MTGDRDPDNPSSGNAAGSNTGSEEAPVPEQESQNSAPVTSVENPPSPATQSDAQPAPTLQLRIGDLTLPVGQPFRPALIPAAARPLVRPSILLVHRFVSVYMWISLVILAAVGVIMCKLPAKLHFFGLLIQGILTVGCLALFISVLFAVNVKRVDIAYQLRRLTELCDGDAEAAKPLALDISSDSSGDTLVNALAMMDGIQSTDANTSSGKTPISPGSHGESAEGHESKHAHEGTHLLPKPPGPFADIEDYSAAAAEGTIAAVRTKMEDDSMYIFDRFLAMVMNSMMTNAVILPLLCFFAGYVMCQLGAPFSGSEFIVAGFLTAVVGPTVLASIRTRVSQQLGVARARVDELNIAAMEEQKAREIEEQQKRAAEAEREREQALSLVVEKEKELEQVKAANEDSKMKTGAQPSFFGIPLPRFDFGSAPDNANTADREESEDRDDENV